MTPIINDVVINVATVNGSGSQSSNNIILKTIFRMGIPVGGKNLFPSNIAGLPTWFTIRANKDNYTSRKPENDVVIAMNLDTIADDIKNIRAGGVFIYNGDLKFDRILLRKDVFNIEVPFRSLVDQTTDQIKIKKLLTNMIYVGVFGQLIGLDEVVLRTVLQDSFAGRKAGALDVNVKAIDVGWKWAKENFKETFPFHLSKMNENTNKIIIDGNTSAALGMVFGGCTVFSWYPITPSTSVAEAFQKYAEKYRKDENGKKTFAVIQAEDELAAIGMVVGAGWAGARAVTATSGPGVSLMGEWTGMSYYAELPAVIWNVQRAGPSTGLPTRTAQGDILQAYTASHGDPRHPVLFPADPAECFEFGQTCFDLAERLQTVVFVLSDLDIGMNLFVTSEFPYPTKPFDRGKILSADAIEKAGSFARYKDIDGDGIPYRTTPGTRHPLAQWVARGSGHNEKAQYTERSDDYLTVVNRLSKKFETAKKILPPPVIDRKNNSKIGILAFGSSDMPMTEARSNLVKNGIQTSYLRLRALPLSEEVDKFISGFDRVYIVEQNRDAQMRSILSMDLPQHTHRYCSVLHYDGMPLFASKISESIIEQEKRFAQTATNNSHL